MAEQRVVQAPAIPVPAVVAQRMDRGRQRMKRDAAKRRLCIRMERGDSWWWINERGKLQVTDTVTYASGGGKPPHRIRNSFNFIRPIVEDKVSAATQRVPAYEIDPATSDPEDAAAAKLAEKVAIYGYDQWDVRGAVIDVVKTAIAHGGQGFALPYFDPNVGPYTLVDDHYVGQGEIKILRFNANECYSEPGVDFDESAWWVVERAMPLYEVYEMPGYVGGELSPDAATSDIPNDRSASERLVIVSYYFERPCPRWPQGRWLTIANARVIVDARVIDPTTEYVWQSYPLRNADGTVIDEPLIHRLVYTHDPDDDNDLGLVWQLIDFQRSLQDCVNKMLELKNRGLNLQMKAPVNSLINSPDDVPNSIRYYKLSPGGEQPEWERPPDPGILNALIQIFNLLSEQMKGVASYQDVQAAPRVAAATVQSVMQVTAARWESFLGDLAQFHSKLMRHCLLLVARYYTEPRILQIRGRMGWESIPDFRGAQLLGQTNVRVFVGSLEYLTKQQILQRVQYYAAMGWVTGQQAIAAIEGGMAEKLVESYDLDVAQVNRIIARIRDGSVMEMPTRTELIDGPPDPATGQATKVPQEVPAWMPNEWNNLNIWSRTLGDWMKTTDYEQTDPGMQGVAKTMWQGIEQLKLQEAAKAAQQQQQAAAGLGMANAAKPQVAPMMPSMPNLAAAPPAQPGPPQPTPGA